MKKISLVILALCLLQTWLMAQVKYEDRLEIELKDDYEGEQIIPFDDKGFLLLAKKKGTEGGQEEWKFDAYNTDLRLGPSSSFKLDKDFYFSDRFKTDDCLYLLFKNRKYEFLIIKLRLEDMHVERSGGRLLKKSVVTKFVVLGDLAYLVVSVKGDNHLLRVDLKNDKSTIIPIMIPGFSAKRTSLGNVEIMEDDEEIMVMVKGSKSKKESEYFSLILNNNSSKPQVFPLSTDIEENLVNVSATKIDGNSYIFTGTYSDRNSSWATGLFFAKGSNGKLDFIRFHSFLDLKNFLDYLPENKANKIEKKRDRKMAKGKDYDLHYLMAMHHIIVTDEGYLFLGEAYYPTYRTETYTSTSTVNGRVVTTTNTRTVFDGFKYTHAVLAMFDMSGYLRWDICFKMDPFYKPFYEKKFISVALNKQEAIKMVYVDGNSINMKAVSFSGKEMKTTSDDFMQTGEKNSKTITYFSYIDFWFDDYFIAYGAQTVKNTELKGEDRKRKVYFVNKIKVNTNL
ncbi:hypothetical protein GC194_04270 [bacterium]|nr:hypothetical protein [bacterium]